MNDLAWYTKYPELIAAASNLPFVNRPGMEISQTFVQSNGVDLISNWEIPGTLVLDWIPSLGKSTTNTDPIVVAGKEIYARVRSSFSGQLDADAPDFIVYLLTLDSIFAYIAYLKRIYRILTAWSPNNYVIPDGLLFAMNLSSTEIEALRRDRVNLWQRINELIHQASKFTCPAVMHVIDRHFWMSDNVYCDANSINSQFYIFNMVGVLRFEDLPTIDDPDITAGGLQLAYTPFVNLNADTRDVSVEALYQFGLNMIQRLVDWDDAYTINGYLKRAFEGTPMFTLSLLDQYEELKPIYNEEVLTQIENAECIQYGRTAINVATDPIIIGETYQQNVAANLLQGEPTATIPIAKLVTVYDKHPVSLRSDNPVGAMNVIATRLKSMYSTTSTVVGTARRYSIIAGTEVVIGMRILDGSQPSNEIRNIVGTAIESVADANNVPVISYAWLAQFDWHPQTVLYNGSAFAIMGDIHNISFVSQDVLNNINRVCLFSEFNAFA